jgi:hypothetical protein
MHGCYVIIFLSMHLSKDFLKQSWTEWNRRMICHMQNTTTYFALGPAGWLSQNLGVGDSPRGPLKQTGESPLKTHKQVKAERTPLKHTGHGPCRGGPDGPPRRPTQRSPRIGSASLEGARLPRAGLRPVRGGALTSSRLRLSRGSAPPSSGLRLARGRSARTRMFPYAGI